MNEYELTSADLGLLAEIRGYLRHLGIMGRTSAREYEEKLGTLLDKLVSYKSV